MPITIYGTHWCDDTRRTRAFLASKGVRPKFIDIDARPEAARGLSLDGKPISIPIVVFDDGSRLDEPTQEELERAFGSSGVTPVVRHRTKLNQALRRFEQYRNDALVASAAFEDRSGTIVITALLHHEPRDISLEAENVERLTAGLYEIVSRSGRQVDIDIPTEAESTDEHASTATTADSLDAKHGAAWPDEGSTAALVTDSGGPSALGGADAPGIDVPDDTPAPARPRGRSQLDVAATQRAETTADVLQPAAEDDLPSCPLTKRFTDLWSSGADHREAAEVARAEAIGQLATIKGLHSLWEMPLTPEAMALAFGESDIGDLAAMFHVLGWLIEQNPMSTMSEFQAFDDATGTSVKTRALSLAQRPRDTIALVDRMGPGLSLRTIDEQRAQEMAAITINEAQGLLKIQEQSTLRYSFGWMFLYQSAAYLETGDYSTMISGNAPLLVDRFTGALWVTGTEERPDVYADNYCATGNPLVSPDALG